MGVRITTTEKKTALFDSVSGFAFGPVFDDEFEADRFLEWLDRLHERGGSFVFAGDTVPFKDDARAYSPAELEHLFGRWLDELDNAEDAEVAR